MPLPPMAELHLHLEGTLQPDLVFELAARNGIALPYADEADLRSRYEFGDLQSFLDLYYENMMVLRTEEDFADLTRAYLARVAAAGVRHAEIMFDPQAHLVRGVDLATCVNGVAGVLATSERDFGVSTLLIAAFLRDRPVAEATEVLEQLIASGAPIVAVGLDSAEVGHPPGPFEAVFRRAREAGLRCTAHAGEEGPPDYVWDALDVLRVERIDHGIRSLEDPRLVERLCAEDIALTVCPLSNVRLQVVDELGDHPLPRMLAAGLRVTISSDDPAYFGGYVDDNMRGVAQAFALDVEQLAQLARNSFTASFLPLEQKAAYLDEVDAWQQRAQAKVAASGGDDVR